MRELSFFKNLKLKKHSKDLMTILEKDLQNYKIYEKSSLKHAKDSRVVFVALLNCRVRWGGNLIKLGK